MEEAAHVRVMVDTEGDAGLSYSYRYYAVRKGKTVQHCIFLQWQDCQGQVEDFEEADYSIFGQDQWQQALDYLNVKPVVCVATAGKRKQPPSASTGDSTVSKKKPKKATTKTKNDRNRYYEPLHKLLLEGYLQCRPKGWRRDELGLTFREPHKQSTQSKYLQDLMELRGFLSTTSVGATAEDSMITPAQRASIKAQSDHTILQPHSIRYLNHSWGVNRKYHNDLDDQLFNSNSSAQNKTDNATNSAFTECTIESREAARMRYTAKKLYLHHRVEELTQQSKHTTANGGVGFGINGNKHTTATRGEDDDGVILDETAAATDNTNNNVATTNKSLTGRNWKQHLQRQAAQEWGHQLTYLQKKEWQEKERLHDLEQPNIKPRLIKILEQDPQRSISKLLQDINYWCGRTTVSKWKQNYFYNKHNGSSRTRARTREATSTTHRNRKAAASSLKRPAAVVTGGGGGGGGISSGNATGDAARKDKRPNEVQVQNSANKMPTHSIGDQPNNTADGGLIFHNQSTPTHYQRHPDSRDGQSPRGQGASMGQQPHVNNNAIQVQQHPQYKLQQHPHHPNNNVDNSHRVPLPPAPAGAHCHPLPPDGRVHGLAMTVATTAATGEELDSPPAAMVNAVVYHNNSHDGGATSKEKEDVVAGEMGAVTKECTLEEDTEPVPLEGRTDLGRVRTRGDDKSGGGEHLPVHPAAGYDNMMDGVDAF